MSLLLAGTVLILASSEFKWIYIIAPARSMITAQETGVGRQEPNTPWYIVH